jgi:hypothetical protein
VPVNIVHPEPSRHHHPPFLFAQVLFDRPVHPTEFSVHLYASDDGDSEVQPVFQRWYQNLCGIAYKLDAQRSRRYRLQASDGDSETKYVDFRYDPVFDVPALTWPRANDVITSSIFMAYGTASDALDVAAKQTMVPSPTRDPGSAQSTTAGTAWYNPSTQSFQICFGPISNGYYLLTVVDDENDAHQEDPVRVNHS